MKTLVALVGMKHRGTEEIVKALPQGEPLTLVREPGNPHDPNAIQVWAQGHHVGYVKATQARALAMAMDRAALAMPGGAARPAYAKPAKLAIDGGKWPMVEIDE